MCSSYVVLCKVSVLFTALYAITLRRHPTPFAGAALFVKAAFPHLMAHNSVTPLPPCLVVIKYGTRTFEHTSVSPPH